MQMFSHFLAAGLLELQSPAYELAENVNESRREVELEIENSSLKFRSKWTSIRPHLNLGHSDVASEAASNFDAPSSDLNFRLSTLTSQSLFGKLVE